MDLKLRRVDGVVVAEVRGQLLGGPENFEKFHSFFKSLLDEGERKFVVNLRHTPHANSQGIGMLIGAYTSATKAGGTLVLAHVLDRIKDILSVTRLLIIFRAFDTEEEAVKYLAGWSGSRPEGDTGRT